MKKVVLLFLVVGFLGSCSKGNTISKKSRKDLSDFDSTPELVDYANDYFWEQFHKNDYSKIDSVLYFLKAAASEDPNSLTSVSHLGFTHMWAISESNKLSNIPPTITDHAILAMNAHSEAYALNPNDPRILGFLADEKMTVGSIKLDNTLQKQGYFDGLKSIRQWSSFNKFTIGYVLGSNKSYDDAKFAKALKWQWQTVDECYCDQVDRENPSIAKYMPMEFTEKNKKRKRACWNSWVAPHNVEGFYLNMGDFIVKDGNPELAKKIYALAKNSPQYDSWPYQDFLERRIVNAEENVENFRKEIDKSIQQDDDKVILLNSSISCGSCHKMTTKDNYIYAGFDHKSELDEEFYFIK